MNLFYREKGAGHPLLILHGLWGASDNWLQIAGLLSDCFRVILPDLRNHGQSPHSKIHDYDALSDDIIAFIDQLQLKEHPFIAGHSMGGKTLMALLLKKPEMVEKAVVIDIAPASYPVSEQDAHLRLADFITCNNLSKYHSRKEVTELISAQFKENDLCQLLLKNIRKEDRYFAWKINGEAIKNNIKHLTGWSQEFEYSTYNQEVLFIEAGRSGYIRKEDRSAIKDIFPKAILQQVPDSDHCIHASQPGMLASVIKNFLTPSSGFLSHS